MFLPRSDLIKSSSKSNTIADVSSTELFKDAILDDTFKPSSE